MAVLVHMLVRVALFAVPVLMAVAVQMRMIVVVAMFLSVVHRAAPCDNNALSGDYVIT